MKDQRLKHEIEHGRKIAGGAEDIWGWSGKIGGLRWERRVKMLLGDLRPGMRVLEVGCGTGLLTMEAVKTGAKIYSLDVSPDLLRLARGKSACRGVDFFCASAYELGFRDKSFDYVIGMSVLHHLDIDKAFKEFSRVLKDNGKIIFSEPNMLNPHIFAERHFFRERFHNSPDETAFIRFLLKRKIREYKFRDIVIEPFDFLYPGLPASLAGAVNALSRIIEKIPVASEFAGSLFIKAGK
ncbi:MAG: class I SAM-dependent methyltransferase [Deltaproteobacteria bacterium]|nr:class I SAM-dependent methyltransferase [Deltaproteobacteria bacterium]